jgi:hypothetical protein
MRAPVKELRQSQRSLRASITSLREAIHRARYPDALHLELRRLEQSCEELGRRIAAEQAALDEPHAFVRPRLGIWCTRCGGTRDQLQLHPPEMQVTNDAAHAAQGGA